MLVDDEETVVKLLKMLLEMDGFEVRVAPSSELALQRAVEWKPDGFLVDYNLTDGSGIDLITKLRSEAEFENVAIIMASGHPKEEEALAAGANVFLLKPFEPNDLVDAFTRLTGMA